MIYFTMNINLFRRDRQSFVAFFLVDMKTVDKLKMIKLFNKTKTKNIETHESPMYKMYECMCVDVM